MAISPRTDEEIQEDVLNELRWEPCVCANEIDVITRDGVIKLLGWVDSYVQKVAAEAAARRVRGVRVVVNGIEVRLASSAQRTNDSLAKSVKDILAWHVPVPIDDQDVMVSNGWVTLKGEVEYNFQKKEAEHAVQHIPGVKGITNLITDKPNPVPGDLKLKIEKALVRNAETDAKHIQVEVKGSTVILRGRCIQIWRNWWRKRARGRLQVSSRVKTRLRLIPPWSPLLDKILSETPYGC